MSTCRCGHDGTGDHPCHGNDYECRKPATRRFYSPRMVGLPGVQFKVQMTDTWACDKCWQAFLTRLQANGGGQ